jgi:hypothetical protein
MFRVMVKLECKRRVLEEYGRRKALPSPSPKSWRTKVRGSADTTAQSAQPAPTVESTDGTDDVMPHGNSSPTRQTTPSKQITPPSPSHSTRTVDVHVANPLPPQQPKGISSTGMLETTNHPSGTQDPTGGASVPTASSATAPVQTLTKKERKKARAQRHKLEKAEAQGKSGDHGTTGSLETTASQLQKPVGAVPVAATTPTTAPTELQNPRFLRDDWSKFPEVEDGDRRRVDSTERDLADGDSLAVTDPVAHITALIAALEMQIDALHSMQKGLSSNAKLREENLRLRASVTKLQHENTRQAKLAEERHAKFVAETDRDFGSVLSRIMNWNWYMIERERALKAREDDAQDRVATAERKRANLKALLDSTGDVFRNLCEPDGKLLGLDKFNQEYESLLRKEF